MGYWLGVDLGTTWTAAAIVRDGGAPAIVSLGSQSTAIPTVVCVQADGEWLVGDAAARRAVTDPDRVCREFKRRVGDTVPVLVAGSPYTAESLLVTVLHWVVNRVSQLEGGPPDAIVATHPANWGPLRRELLEKAFVHGGLTVRMATEPEAAAVHYASATRVPDGTVFAVYDLGGGTFDATVLRKSAAGFEVLGQPDGIERFGGLDIDAALLSHITESFAPTWEALDPDDPAAIASVLRLRDECVAAKEALSEDADTSVSVVLPSLTTDVRVTRGELEQMIRPAVERSADVLEHAITGAGVGIDAIDRILLVGGSSRIPLVAQVLSQHFARPLALDAHPKDSIALGAARLAAGDRLAAAPVTAATMPPPVVPAAPSPPPAAPPPFVAVPQPSTPSERPQWLVPAVVAAVVLVALVAFLATRGGGGSSPTAATQSTSSSSSVTTSTTSTTAPRSAQSLVGRWLLSGPPSQCIGLSQADCQGFTDRGVNFNVDVECAGTACTVAIGQSPAAPLTGAGPFIASGTLSGSDGFSCQGQPDPTRWRIVIDDPGTTGTAESFKAETTLTSDGPDKDPNSCAFEQVTSSGTATRKA